MAKRSINPMERARTLFERSGLSLDELGKRMGYSGDTARKAAWQFLNKTTDPRLSMLQRFAEALHAPLVELFK
jgi:transcriptional regulator with XRE-family HTH domain